MKKNIFLLSALLFFTVVVSGQDVISTQGDSYSNAEGSIDFTIGEVVINTETDGTTDITQGFHQTKWNFLSTEILDESIEVLVFPNPTDDKLTIEATNFSGISYSLLDVQGKEVLANTLVDKTTLLEVTQLSAGNYTLQLTNSDKKIKTIKLIKN